MTVAEVLGTLHSMQTAQLLFLVVPTVRGWAAAAMLGAAEPHGRSLLQQQQGALRATASASTQSHAIRCIVCPAPCNTSAC